MVRVLDVSYSPVSRDPRVLRQIDWIQNSGSTVDVVGLGSKPNSLDGEFFEIGVPSIFKRISLYLLTTNSYRYRKLILDQLPPLLKTKVTAGHYDIIHLNDLEFVPWIKQVQISVDSTCSSFRSAIDLHEYFPGVKGGIIWKIFIKRFSQWLFRELLETNFDCYSTVSKEISVAYSTNFGMPEMEVIWNSPEFFESAFSERSNSEIKLIYHGNSGKGRPIALYMRALRLSSSPVSLNLMLTSGKYYRKSMQFYSYLLGISDRVHWHDPVPVSQISRSIQPFDVELVWLPPISESLHLSLANKFFEAIQGRLAVIIGQSPSMVSLVDEFQLGVVTRGWTLSDLVKTLDGLNRDDVERWRNNSSNSAKILSSDSSRATFLSSVIAIA